MSRALAMLLSGLLLSAGAGVSGQGASAPGASEQETDGTATSPWRHNPRGRTETGIELQGAGELEAAGEAFAEALDLAPADPLVRYNAGTASLLGGGGDAVELLQSAAQLASPELQPIAYYNLGNAQLAARSLPEAIESYKQSLRLDPTDLDVKHNLELAQRLLEEQQQQEEDQRQEQDPNRQEGESQGQPQSQEQQQDESQQEQQPDGSEQEQQPQPRDRERPLPDFEDQPDMTAEQAAAILEAVENLEREERRKQALEQLKRAKGDRDW